MISVLYNIILITNFKLIEMCIKSSPSGEGTGEGPAGDGGGAYCDIVLFRYFSLHLSLSFLLLLFVNIFTPLNLSMRFF